MYRAVGLILLRHGIDIFADTRDATAIRAIVDRLTFELDGNRVLTDGVDLTADLFTEEIGRAASRVGLFAEVREKLKAEQRRIAAGRDVICEGRDQGTAVFPDAPVKFFFVASPEVRAERRVRQLLAANAIADPAVVLGQIRDRDHQDETRSLDPLRRADDAVLLDTTTRTPDDVHALMVEVVNRWRSRR